MSNATRGNTHPRARSVWIVLVDHTHNWLMVAIPRLYRREQRTATIATAAATARIFRPLAVIVARAHGAQRVPQIVPHAVLPSTQTQKSPVRATHARQVTTNRMKTRLSAWHVMLGDMQEALELPHA